MVRCSYFCQSKTGQLSMTSRFVPGEGYNWKPASGVRGSLVVGIRSEGHWRCRVVEGMTGHVVRVATDGGGQYFNFVRIEGSR